VKKIERLSASQVSSFDPETTWGCNRRWWFRNIQGKKEPQNKSMMEGEATHAEIEHFLKTGVNGMGPVALSAFEYMPKPGTPGMLVEHTIADGELFGCGVPFTGKIDVFMAEEDPPRIIDWKTSSNVMLYKKQPSALKVDTQVLTYAMWALSSRPVDQVNVELVFMQTGRSRYSDNSKVTLERAEVEAGWRGVEAVVTRMLDTAQAERVEDIQPTEGHCQVGRSRCPHFDYCPRSGVFSMSSFLDLLDLPDTASVTAAPAAAPQVAEEQLELPLSSLPATPEPETANPLAAAPEVRRGRPPGAKNKPKVADLAPMAPLPMPVVTMEGPKVNPPTAPVAAPATTTFTKVSVRHGLTINLGNYQSAKVEVEAEALVGVSVEDTLKTVREQVLASLKQEAAPYLAQMAAAAEKGGK
jgi:hypothetical protein